MGKPELKLATIGLTPKEEVLKCLHKVLGQIESGEVEPGAVAVILSKVSDDDDLDDYRIYSSNLRRDTMLWLFEIGKRYCFDGEKDDAAV